MQNCEIDGQLMLFVLESPDETPVKPLKHKSTAASMSVLISIPYFHLDLSKGHVDLFGCHYWEFRAPWREDGPPLNTGVAPREPIKRALSEILEAAPDRRYYLSRIACLGILRRAKERNKELPPQLKWALMVQAGLIPPDTGGNIPCTAFAANQREKVNCREAAREAALGREVRDLHDAAGALGAQFMGDPIRAQHSGSYGERSRSKMSELSPQGGSERYGACGDEKQQTFIADKPVRMPFSSGVVAKGNGECFLSPERHTSISGGGGMPGQGYPCVLTAGFCAGAAPTAGGIGYQEETAPTLKAAESGTNMVPSILCLNDQGGQRMDITMDQTTTIRAQMGGHQPLICLNDQGGSVMDCTEDITGTLRAQEHGHQPLVFENHGVDARYTGPHPVSPTLSARAGTGGNNLPLALQAEREFGTSMECQDIIAPADHHAVFSRQRVDVFRDDEIASTESARQHKDATDLVYQIGDPAQAQRSGLGGERRSSKMNELSPQGGSEGYGACDDEGALTSSDRKGPNSQYVGQDKLIVDGPLLIRRLTPLECERLQGFPDGWTDLPGTSDSARYKALGNSVAIPCVEFIMRGIAMASGY